MNHRIIAAVFAGLAIGASTLAIAADPGHPMGAAQDHQRMRGSPGMPGMQGMQGMHGMMGSCPGRMDRHDAANSLVPQLPPGNEKLQLQMRAEIMQKTGEILAKYAAQLK